LLAAFAAAGLVLAGTVPAVAGVGSVAPSAAATTAKVTRIVDGDTIVTTRGTIRVIGIDTPERGRCGFGPATSQAKRLAPVGSRVVLTRAPGKSRDRYGRHLRYVSRSGVDFGGAQIKAGLADARYDSRDGYGWHPKQRSYVSWDKRYPNKYSRSAACPASGQPSAPSQPSVQSGTYFPNCTAARSAGAAPVRVGDPGYGRHLDRDGDGVACE